MGWLRQSYTQPPSGLHVGSAFFDWGIIGRSRAQKPAHAQVHLGLAALIAASLLGPFKTHALETADKAYFAMQTGAAQRVRAMSDPELGRIWAKGFSDPRVDSNRIFDGASKYAAGGNAVSVLGQWVTFLNPPVGMLLQMLDAETSFNNITYDPHVPATISTTDGTMLVRLPSTIGELSFRNIHLKNSTGASYGDVTIRNVEMGGTRIIVKRH